MFLELGAIAPPVARPHRHWRVAHLHLHVHVLVYVGVGGGRGEVGAYAELASFLCLAPCDVLDGGLACFDDLGGYASGLVDSAGCCYF